MSPRRGGLLITTALMGVVGGCLSSVNRLYDDAVGVIDDAGTSGSDALPLDVAGPSVSPATIGGNATGVGGPGLVLQNAGKDELPVFATGPFSFKTKLFPGERYDVSVLTQPVLPSQKCTVTNGSGEAAGVDVTNVAVDCVTDAYKVGGNVVGLVGSGLVLQNNGGDDLPVGGASFTFASPVASGSAYNVTIKTQPSGQSCTVGGATGTIVTGDVSSVVINCLANSYIIGGKVDGLVGSLVLQNNGTNDREVTANGTFAFSTPIASGSAYAVTVKTQPTTPVRQTCAVTKGSGDVAASDITDVSVACTTNKYTVGGTVTGLTGTLVLQNNGGNDKTITANDAFTFSQSVASGAAYSVTVLTQPFNQACQVTSGSGTIVGSNVNTVKVTCSTLVAFSEDFDGVTAPALPTGWTKTTAEGNAAWNSNSDASSPSQPNSMLVSETLYQSDIRLESPAFTVESSTAVLSFQNKWYMPSKYGGGALEISIDGAAFQDITAAGGIFMSGAPNSKLANTAGALGGRLVWTGTGGFVTTSVRLPAAAAGKSVRLRWRFASFFWSETKAWRFDDVVVRN